MKFSVFALLAFLLLFPSLSRAENEFNAGFVNGLWYATPTFFANEPTRIYVALRNYTDHDLTGTVRFTDNEKRIGVAYISALPGRLVEAWVDWTPTYGEHVLVATLSEVRLHTIGEAPETAEVISMLAQDTRMVDYDTDHDGSGNTEDTDDDNDGISDNEEIAHNSDPLVATPVENKAEKPETVTREDTNDSKQEVHESESTQAEGLERYTKNGGTVDTLLSNVTEKVRTTKDTVDAYRTTRESALEQYFGAKQNDTQNFIASSSDALSSTSLGELATITRTKIKNDDESFLYALFEGIKALGAGFLTLILYVLSHSLAHPALIQLIILVGILYLVYRTARKFGRRPHHT